MPGPSFVIGNIARGDDFWNREAELEDIRKTLKKNNVLLKAPRRFGKTSIMERLMESFNGSDEYKIFFLDTEGLREPEDFISAIISTVLSDQAIRNLFKSASEFIGGLIARFNVGIGYEDMPEIRLSIKEAVKNDWMNEGNKLTSVLKKYDGSLIFILDEIPVLLKNIERRRKKETVRAFLNWFRAVRQQKDLSHVRWVLGGSIGIENVIRQMGASITTINDFHIIKIEPFTDAEARSFIKALLKTEGYKHIKKPVMDTFIDIVGAPVPYFIQIMVKESLSEMKKQKKKALNKELIEKVYREHVLGPTNRTYFEHYYTRLKDYYDTLMESVAKRLLLEIAREKNVKKPELLKLFNQETKGKRRRGDFDYLMSDLENDFYIKHDGETNTYCFATNVLRDWWRRYYDYVEDD